MKNKKEKVNPIINTQKDIKNIKIKGTNSSDDNTIKKLIIIIFIIVVILVFLYGFTEILKKDESNEDPIVTGTVNYDKISVGTLLNRPYDNYYVMVYNAEDNDAVLYSTILTKYMQKTENNKKIYFCDLNNKLNNEYYDINKDGKSNPEATSIDALNFGNLTLLEIEKGKIVNYIEDIDGIKKILQ